MLRNCFWHSYHTIEQQEIEPDIDKSTSDTDVEGTLLTACLNNIKAAPLPNRKRTN
jgi:hypothetical protein